MEVLERLLADLNQSLEQSSSLFLDSKEIVSQIEECVFKELSSSQSSETNLFLAVLLKSASPPNIIDFLKYGLRSKDRDLVGAKNTAFVFLNKLVKHLDKEFESYSQFFVTEVFDLFRRETESNEIRAGCLKCISTIVKSCGKFAIEYQINGASGEPDVANNAIYLIDILMEESQRSKASQSVKGNALTLIGILIAAIEDNDDIASKAEAVLTLCDAVLYANFEVGKDIEMAAITGAFSCIDRCLFKFADHYTQTITSTKQRGKKAAQLPSLAQLFRYTNMAIDGVSNVSRYAVPSKALRLLSNHASLFSNLLGVNCKTVYSRILVCLRHETPKIKKHAEPAYDATMTEIGLAICDQLPDSAADFDYFFREFLEMISNSSSPPNEVGFSLTGIAALGPAITKRNRSSQEAVAIVNKLLGLCDKIINQFRGLSTEDDVFRDGEPVLRRKCDFAYAVSCFFQSLDSEISTQIVSRLQQLLSDIIIGYPRLMPRNREKICRTVIQIIFSMRNKPDILRLLLQGGIAVLLTRTMSRVEVYEYLAVPIINTTTLMRDKRLVFVYVNFWRELICPSNQKTLQRLVDGDKRGSVAYGQISLQIYFELMTQVVDILKTLDLAYVITQQQNNVYDEILFVPNNAADQELLLNLVTFMETVLSEVRTDLFKHWVSVLLNISIEKSSAFPHVSAMYRLVGTMLDIVRDQGLLNRISMPRQTYSSSTAVMSFSADHEDFAALVEEDDNAMAVEGGYKVSDAELLAAVNTLQQFILSVSVRARQFSDELLFSALSMVLKCPTKVCSPRDLTHTVKLALVVGLSHTPTGHLALSTLERWLSELRSQTLAIVPDILTHFDHYISSNAADLIKSVSTDKFVSKVSRTRKKSRAIAQSVVIANNMYDVAELQQRIVIFLGKLGGHNQGLIGDSLTKVSEYISWDPRVVLLLRLPFIGYAEKVAIRLEQLLPRISQLALQKGNRQVRTIAAECLHGIIIFIVGSTAKDPSGEATARLSYGKLFLKLFPTIISLATDTEVVSRLLFEKLMFQLIHWISGAQNCNEETSSFVESLMNGLMNEESAAIRELSAKGIVSFLKYACKQSKSDSVRTYATSSKDLISALISFAVHPDKQRRIGSYTAICKMYRIFREESNLISLYSLELLQSLLISLRHAHNDPIAFGSVDACCLAIDHMVKIVVVSIIKYEDIGHLVQEIRERSHPRCLGDLIKWLWDHTMSSEARFRRKCMQLFLTLSPCLKGLSSRAVEFTETSRMQVCKKVADKYVSSKGLPSIMESLEGVAGTDNYPIFDRNSPSPSAVTIYQQKSLTWLSCAVRSMDFYCWVVDTGLIDAQSLFLRVSEKPAVASLKRSVAGASIDNSDSKPKILEGMQSFFKAYVDKLKDCTLQNVDCVVNLQDDFTTQKSLICSRTEILTRFCHLLDILASRLTQRVLFELLDRSGLFRGDMIHILFISLIHPYKFDFLVNPVRDPDASMVLFVALEKMFQHLKDFDNFERINGSRFNLNGCLQESVPVDYFLTLFPRQASATSGNDAIFWKEKGSDVVESSIRGFRSLAKVGLLERVIGALAAEKFRLGSQTTAQLGHELANRLIPTLSRNMNDPIELSVSLSLFRMAIELGFPFVVENSRTATSMMVCDNASGYSSVISCMLDTTCSNEWLIGLRGPDNEAKKAILDRCQKFDNFSRNVGHDLANVLSDIAVVKCVYRTTIHWVSQLLGDDVPNEVPSRSSAKSKKSAAVDMDTVGLATIKYYARSMIRQCFDQILKINEQALVVGSIDTFTDPSVRQSLSNLVNVLILSSDDELRCFALDLCISVFSLYRASSSRESVEPEEKSEFEKPSIKPRKHAGAAAVESKISDQVELNAQIQRICHNVCQNVLASPSSSVCSFSLALKLASMILPGVSAAAPVYFMKTNVTDQGLQGEESLYESVVDAADVVLEASRLVNPDQVKTFAAIEELVANVFPLSSHELEANSEAQSRYVTVFHDYLDVVATRGTLCFLAALLPTLREGKRHAHFKWIEECFGKLLRSIPTQNAKQVVSMCNFCLSCMFNVSVNMELKKVMFEFVFLPLLKRCPNETLVEFFTSSNVSISFSRLTATATITIRKLVEIINLQLETIPPHEDVASVAFIQICAYNLIEALFDCVSADLIKGEVTQAFMGSTAASGKEITTNICKETTARLAKLQFPDAVPVELRKQLYYSAFNCLVIVVGRTQNLLKFFENFVFKGRDGPWERVVDKDVIYSFKIETDKFSNLELGRSNLVANAASISTASRRAQVVKDIQASSISKKMLAKLLSSTIMSHSSLSSQDGYSQDARRTSASNHGFRRSDTRQSQIGTSDSYYAYEPDDINEVHIGSSDFTAAIMNVTDSTEVAGESAFDKAKRILGGGVISLDDRVTLELSDVNTQPCMGSLVRVVGTMGAVCGREWQADLTILPRWLANIRDVMQDPLSSVNVKLFFLQLLLNDPVTSVVAPWCNLLLPIVLNVVESVLMSSSSTGFHYLFRDICTAFLGPWKAAKPDMLCTSEASKFMSHLFSICFNPSTLITRSNLGYFANIALIWKEENRDIDINLNPIVELLHTQFYQSGGVHGKTSSEGSKAATRRLTGLVMTTILLELDVNILNRYVPLSDSVVEGVIESLAYQRKEVQKSASMAAGLILKYISQLQRNKPAEINHLCKSSQRLLIRLKDVITEVFHRHQRDQFVCLCWGVSVHYPGFLDRELIVKCLSLLSSVQTREKTALLAAIVKCEFNSGDFDLFDALRSYLPSLMTDMSTEYNKSTRIHVPMLQLWSLRFIRKLLRSLNLEQIRFLLGLSDNISYECRAIHDPASLFDLTSSLSQNSFASHSILWLVRGGLTSVECRQLIYEILVDLLEESPAISEDLNSGAAFIWEIRAYRRLILFALLRGLSDPDDKLFSLVSSSDVTEGVSTDVIDSTSTTSSEIRATSASTVSKSFASLDLLSQDQSMGFASHSTESGDSSGFALSGAAKASSSKQRDPKAALSIAGGIRNKLINYLDVGSRLADTPIDRLNQLMFDYFDPTCVRPWLQYSTNLMLSLCSRSSTYMEELFTTGLGGNYRELPLGSITSSSFDPLTPVFSLDRTQKLTQTFSDSQLTSGINPTYASAAGSQSGLGSYMIRPLGDTSYENAETGIGLIRATQDFNWSQSQQVGGDFEYASRTETGLPQAGMSQFPGQSQSVYQKAKYRFVTDWRSRDSSSEESSTQSQGFKGPDSKWDFLKRLNLNRAYEKADVERSKKQERVTVMRSYRDGEMPYIQILLRDIMRPLQSLVLFDMTLSRHTFVCLFQSLYSSLGTRSGAVVGSVVSSMDVMLSGDSVATSADHESQRRGLRIRLQHLMEAGSVDTDFSVAVLSACRCCLWSLSDSESRRDGNVIVRHWEDRRRSGLLSKDFSWENNAGDSILSMSPAIIANCGLRSLNFHTSAILLEEQLLLKKKKFSALYSEIAEPAAPKKRKPKGAASIEIVEEEKLSADAENCFQSATQSWWLQLSRIYSALSESDILMGISSKVTESVKVHNALNCELEGNFRKAADLYNEIVDDPSISAMEAKTWVVRCISCFDQLMSWGEQYDFVQEQCGNVTEQLWGDTHRDLYLKPYIRSMLNSERNEELMEFLDSSFSLPSSMSRNSSGAMEDLDDLSVVTRKTSLALKIDKKQWLESEMTDETALYFLMKNDVGKVQKYNDMSINNFLSAWSGLHKCASAARRSRLVCLQSVVELHDFISYYFDSRSLSAPSPTVDLLNQWSKVMPSISADDMVSWNRIILTRATCLHNIVSRMQHETGDIKSGWWGRVSNMCSLHMSQLFLAASLSAVDHGNLTTARRLQSCGGDLRIQSGEPILAIETMSTIKCSLLSLVGQKADERIAVNMQIVSLIDDELECKHRRLTNVRLLLSQIILLKSFRNWLLLTLGSVSEDLSFCLFSKGDVAASSSHLQTAFRSYSPTSGGRSGVQTDFDEHSALFDADLSYCSSSSDLCLALLCDNLISVQKISDLETQGTPASLISSFSTWSEERWKSVAPENVLEEKQVVVEEKQSVKKKKASIPTKTPRNSFSIGLASRIVGSTFSGNNDLLPSTAVTFYMRALCNCNELAIERIPRILMLIASFESARAAFLDCLQLVPPWVFLRWTSQLISLVNRPEGSAISKALERIAIAYPKALFYPFNITRTSLSNEALRSLRNVQSILQDSSMSAFIEALRGLHNPDMRVKDSLKAVKQLAKANKLTDAAIEWEKLYSDLFVPDKPFIGDKIGDYNKDFMTRVGKKVSRVFSQSVLGIVQAEADNYTKANRVDGKTDLSKFSTWMCDFDPTFHFLEMPGLYHGLSEPKLELHPRILSFDRTLLVMPSMRKPKRIKVHGSDERDYCFLVKGGEDLRNDERIEQMFGVMNRVLSRDAHCNSGSFSVNGCMKTRTYSVIPMSTDIGILEWVNNTAPLKSILVEEVVRLKSVGEARHAIDRAQEFFKKKYLEEGGTEKYHFMYSADDEAIAEMMRLLHLIMPNELLRRRFLSLAPAAEAFSVIRSEFSKSVAVFSVSCYILGIGDRHLDNFLVDSFTGTVVAIDFGHAFGTATSLLPVPELIPFRLTKCFTDVLQPLDAVSLLKQWMIKSLSAYRSSDSLNILVGVADVYVNDPIVEWVGGVIDRNEFDIKRDEITWEPRRKITVMFRKLKGCNPVQLLMEELGENVTVTDKYRSRDALNLIAQGVNNPKNMRWKDNVRGKDLDASVQVQCLIEMATDVNLIGRQYLGLQMWV